MKHYPTSLFNTSLLDFPRNDLFKHFFRDNFFSEGSSSMPLDIKEEDDKFVVEAELPGFEKKDVSIKIADNTLTIEAETKMEKEEKKYHRRERYYGHYQRSISLGDNCSSEKITASMKNGILIIEIPKIEPEPAKEIVIT
jgi:HSP20 family protein